MPIYEFKCSKCEEFFELLIMSKDKEEEVKCPKCGSVEFERVMSTTYYSMGDGPKQQKPSIESRTCSSGSCNTWNIPGASRS